MITTNHTTLRMSGALNIEHLTALKLHIGVNAHGWAIVEGEAGENALEQLSGALAGREQHILTLDESGAEKCLFAGVIREAEMVRVGGYNRFHVELLSGTCLMDREVRSRSFQDVSRTYSQVAQQVCSEYSGGAAICTVGEDKTLGQPVIQYRETDWEFLMRMASHCGGVLVPETHRGLPRLWFGFPDRSFTCEFPEDAYTSGVSQRYYELGGSAAGYSKADFFYYDVESPQLCDLGWYTVFKGQPFIIAEKSARLERGELIFTYRLGRPGFGWSKILYNEKISGMTLLGEVLETSRETLKLKLDIDKGWNSGGPYPYTWRPETGNFMYCMPQVGTRVSLYCPNYDEKAAIAVNCVRTNGGSCGRMSTPSKRSFVTEHGKEMNLYPQEMSLVNADEGDILGAILMSDDDGISIVSKNAIAIIALQDVAFSAPIIEVSVVDGELELAKVVYSNSIVICSVTMSNRYDFLSKLFSHLEGWKLVSFVAYDDGPQLAETDDGFNWDLFGDIFGGAVIGLAVVGLLAIAGVVAAAIAGIAATTAIVGGAWAVGIAFAGTVVGGFIDYHAGEARPLGQTIMDSISWGITGILFFTGAHMLTGLEYVGTKIGQLTIKEMLGAAMGTGATVGLASGVLEFTLQTFQLSKENGFLNYSLNDYDWDKINSSIRSGMMGGIFAGSAATVGGQMAYNALANAYSTWTDDGNAVDILISFLIGGAVGAWGGDGMVANGTTYSEVCGSIRAITGYAMENNLLLELVEYIKSLWPWNQEQDGIPASADKESSNGLTAPAYDGD